MGGFKVVLRGLWLPALFLFLAGCGGSGSSGVSAGPFSVSPASLTFTTTADGATPASQTLTITPNTGAAAVPDITASGSAILTNPSAYGCLGNTSNLDCTGDPSGITVTVPVPDPVTLGAGTFTGSILISSVDGSVNIPVTYTINPGTPAVSQVSPSVAVAGQTANVTIRGGGFANFGGTVPTVTFGGTAGTNAKVVSDSAITVDLPATLAAGSQAVAVSGAKVGFPSTASLDVVAAPSFPADSISLTGPRLRYIYDDARQAIYAVNAVDNVLEKYTYDSVGSTWNSPTTVAIPSPNPIADAVLSTDGSTILVVSNNNKIYKVDPAAWTVNSGVAVSGQSGVTLDCNIDNCFDSLAVDSDGRAFTLDNSLYLRYFYLYDPATDGATGSFNLLPGFNQYSHGTLHRSRIGNRAVITDTSLYYVYNSVGNFITEYSYALAAPIAVSGDGKTIVASTVVLRDNGAVFASYGTLPVSPAAVALSLDGNTAYVLNTSGVNPVLQVYDLSSGGTATQIGSDISLAADPGAVPAMAMSIDDSYAFIGGTSNLVIVPVTP